MLRRAVLILLMCALVCAQSAPLASAHAHHNSSQHCCLLCHAGPLPFLQATASALMSPFISAVWLEPPPPISTPGDHAVSTHDSRGPPA
jgi:hypothetical protein